MAPLMLLGFVGLFLYGIASLRSREFKQTVGVLLLAPLLIFAAMFASGFSPMWLGFLLASTQTLVLVGLGFSLPTDVPKFGEQPAQQPSAA